LNKSAPSVAKHHQSLTLQHHGDCALLGVRPDLTLYAEEIYGEDDDLSRCALRLNGKFFDCVEEGAFGVHQVLALSADLIDPRPVQHTHALNFSLGLQRGRREDERIAQVVHALTLQEKMAVTRYMGLNIMPPLMLGIVESVVLAEALWQAPSHYLVCRRFRFAYALTQPRTDTHGQQYDYDTLTMHVAYIHPIGADEYPLDKLLEDSQTLWGNVKLYRPMDCLIYQDHLFVADGGDKTRLSTVHVWEIGSEG
jgi:hypothetical protein